MSEQNEIDTTPASSTKPEAEVADKAKAKAQREDAKRKAHITKEYPHALPETLQWYPAHNKYGCMCKSVVSGKEFGPVMTSDLFQVDRTEEERKAQKTAKKQANKVLMEKAKALVVSGAVK